MKRNSSEIQPASPEELAKFMQWLEKEPDWIRMNELQERREQSGLTVEETEELRKLTEPKLRKGDVMLEFMQELDDAEKARGEESGSES